MIKRIKRLIMSIFLLSCLFGTMGSAIEVMGGAEGSKFPYDNTPTMGSLGGQTENLGEMLGQGTTDGDTDTILDRLLDIFGFGGSEYDGVPKALIYIKFIINLLLWLVSFVALVIVIYSFYLMFFTEDSKGIDQVKKNLIGVAIALVVLGVSRFIVSFIFDFYQTKLLNAA